MADTTHPAALTRNVPADALRDFRAYAAQRDAEAAKPRKSTRDQIIDRIGEAAARRDFPHYF